MSTPSDFSTNNLALPGVDTGRNARRQTRPERAASPSGGHLYSLVAGGPPASSHLKLFEPEDHYPSHHWLSDPPRNTIRSDLEKRGLPSGDASGQPGGIGPQASSQVGARPKEYAHKKKIERLGGFFGWGMDMIPTSVTDQSLSGDRHAWWDALFAGIKANGTYGDPPSLTETLEDIRAILKEWPGGINQRFQSEVSEKRRRDSIGLPPPVDQYATEALRAYVQLKEKVHRITAEMLRRSLEKLDAKQTDPEWRNERFRAEVAATGNKNIVARKWGLEPSTSQKDLSGARRDVRP